MFERALLISIFLIQVFAFAHAQFAAVIGLIIDLALFLAVREILSQEFEREAPEPMTTVSTLFLIAIIAVLAPLLSEIAPAAMLPVVVAEIVLGIVAGPILGIAEDSALLELLAGPRAGVSLLPGRSGDRSRQDQRPASPARGDRLARLARTRSHRRRGTRGRATSLGR